MLISPINKSDACNKSVTFEKVKEPMKTIEV